MAATLLAACVTSSSRVRTYVEPSLEASGIRRVAIFPIRNPRLTPDESEALGRGFAGAFESRNPEVDVLEPRDAARDLDRAGLAERYGAFLRSYAASGIPDTRILRDVADALEVDGIIQGEIVDVAERDGEYHGRGVSTEARTDITMRYVLFEPGAGKVLWSSTASGARKRLMPFGGPPPVYEAASVAQERIVDELPRIGRN